MVGSSLDARHVTGDRRARSEDRGFVPKIAVS
jgi:hypothetical protein